MSFRICTIGCGQHATRVHGPSYRKYADTYPGTVLAACCDLEPLKAASFQRQFGFLRHDTDIRIMLERERPDAVCLVVGESQIAPLSALVLKLGFPLLLEKPPGLTREDTVRIAAAAEASGAPNQVAFNRWHAPLMSKLKQLLDENFAPGDINYIGYDFYRVGRMDEDFATTAIHGISAVSFMAGSPFRKVRFTYRDMPGLYRYAANIYMECEFESGAVGHLAFCPAAGVVIERGVVNALNHTFFLELPIWAAYDHPGRLIHLEDGQLRQELSGDQTAGSGELYITNGFYAENESFFNAIRERRSPVGGVREALQIVELVDCIRQRKSEYVGTAPDG
ncbi:Gfo/Idh/MocA family protein [Paenibacillus piri]|uniref:Gfo/Idh/MocA family oxidoreductase n=1 Tax=Paenibacillus piri TaxID=2547395 RepID=A0A4R5KB80_9BACL|nr:Gfo/Idh/MocA family oxidoreductase [Paenibacillus piri]TDF91230.1 Gfo/Idh/MocA family oxidoreductase [Paenibacillus piri]